MWWPIPLVSFFANMNERKSYEYSRATTHANQYQSRSLFGRAAGEYVVRKATRPLNSIRMYLFSELWMWTGPMRSAPPHTTLGAHMLDCRNGNKSLFIIWACIVEELWTNNNNVKSSCSHELAISNFFRIRAVTGVIHLEPHIAYGESVSSVWLVEFAAAHRRRLTTIHFFIILSIRMINVSSGWAYFRYA